MIPYFALHVLSFGPIQIRVWGLFVAFGFLAGALLAQWFYKKQKLNQEILWNLATVIFVSSFVGARLFHVLFYEPSYFLSSPLEILKIWNGGFSVYGGFAGAFVSGILYLRKKKLNIHDYAGASIFGLPVGLFIGRIGCFLIHDHPGTATDFFLAVKYPDGVSYHDNGLYLSINGLFLTILFLVMQKLKAPLYMYSSAFMIEYGAVRFFLDFTRTADARYLGLTPAQYLSMVLFVTGIIYAVARKNKK
ncbi:MAG: prolipoprotein diacylglyceryl transferase [uncultured bacterium]|nr:MAG: prolipoprotein diacylglyceryl transferase [uncultured bacterium]HBD04887.1 hypothetical protein [Candidatus Uhrbacteria bacterium]